MSSVTFVAEWMNTVNTVNTVNMTQGRVILVAITQPHHKKQT